MAGYAGANPPCGVEPSAKAKDGSVSSALCWRGDRRKLERAVASTGKNRECDDPIAVRNRRRHEMNHASQDSHHHPVPQAKSAGIPAKRKL